jgi:hypothetical protein
VDTTGISSLLKTVRGRSAVPETGGTSSTAPLPVGKFLPPQVTSSKVKAPAPSGAGASFVHPAHCCVYCAHLVYVPPRATRIQCPMCAHELPVQDVMLSGTVEDREIVTAGKIVVVENTIVRARLIACAIEISGLIEGEVRASHLCVLHAVGRVEGLLAAGHLRMAEGAVVTGRIEVRH